MDYEKLKTEVQEIAQIAASVPEPFQQRCFELLLESLLGGGKQADKTPNKNTEEELDKGDKQKGDSGTAVPLNASTRAWMKRTSVTEEQLNALLFVEDGQVHFIKEPVPSTNADAQIEWSLILALRNALLNGNFSVDAEAVRSIVQDKGHYDRKNFASIFKRNAGLYKSVPVPQGETQPLSVEGQQKLAELVKRLVATP